MSFKDFLAKFWAEQKTVITGLIVAFFTLLYSTYFVGTQNPPTAVAIEVAESARMTATAILATPTKATGRITLTVKPPATSTTIVPTPTKPSGITTTPVSTLVVTITPTVVASGCDETKWHQPKDVAGCHHHHGFNPRDSKFKSIFNIDGFDIDDWLDKYGELLQPWATLNENPVGAIWLYRSAGPTGCVKDFEGIDPTVGDEFDCITDVLYRIHDVGTLEHLVNRFHSESFIMKGCTEGLNGEVTSDCGIAAGGVRPDYGLLHDPYKKDICHIPGEPGYPNYPDDEIDQPSYRTGQIEPPRAEEDGVIFNQSYWVNSDINADVAEFYHTGTNWLFNSAWLAMNVWQTFPDALVCDKSPTVTIDMIKALLAQVPPVLEDAHTIFKLNDITLREHPPGPIDKMYDQYGGECDEEDDVCVPLFISANFPNGPVTFHEGAEPSECVNAENPCIFIDTFGVKMIFPPHDK